MSIGLPASRWFFAARIWLAVNLAWGVAFWIQLDGASSAGVTAVILAMQTRGQIFEKSIFRVLGTLLGCVVSIIIVGLFAQARDLYVLAYSAWLGICVFTAGFLDGNRAYGAVLSGYTVSIVAVFQIDDPSSVFSGAVDRGAAVVIGIASITLVNDLLRGPEIGPGFVGRIGHAYAQVRAFTDGLLSEGAIVDTEERMASIMRSVSDQHPLLDALPAETISGAIRADAIRTTLAALVGEIRATHALSKAETYRGPIADRRLEQLVLRRLRGEIVARREAAAAAYSAVRDGRKVPHPRRMPIYRSRENAVLNGVRAFVASVLAAYGFVLSGWPETSVAWGMTGIIICLSSNAPDQRAMTKGALAALPGAVLVAGVTEFLILDGADAFPLLMIGTAPALFLGLLFMSSPRPPLAGAGLLMTVFALAIMAPSNPQSYDAQAFLESTVLFSSAGILVFVLVRVLFPASDARRRGWALSSARRDLVRALRGHGPHRPEDEIKLLDASRIGMVSALKGTLPADIAIMLRMADLAFAARLVWQSLDGATRTTGEGCAVIDVHVPSLRASLTTVDAEGLRRVASVFADMDDEDGHLRLAADLAWAASLIDGSAAPGTSDALVGAGAGK